MRKKWMKIYKRHQYALSYLLVIWIHHFANLRPQSSDCKMHKEDFRTIIKILGRMIKLIMKHKCESYVLTSIAGNLRRGVRQGCQERWLPCIWEPDGVPTQDNQENLDGVCIQLRAALSSNTPSDHMEVHWFSVVTKELLTILWKWLATVQHVL